MAADSPSNFVVDVRLTPHDLEVSTITVESLTFPVYMALEVKGPFNSEFTFCVHCADGYSGEFLKLDLIDFFEEMSKKPSLTRI